MARDLGSRNYIETQSGRGGTVYYIAPEIWNGQPYNARSDLWALGCIFYELCTLELAFPGGDVAQIYGKINAGRYDPIPANLPYSYKVRQLVDLLLQKIQNSARIPGLPLSELKMPNYGVKNYDNGDKFEGQFKDEN